MTSCAPKVHPRHSMHHPGTFRRAESPRSVYLFSSWWTFGLCAFRLPWRVLLWAHRYVFLCWMRVFISPNICLEVALLGHVVTTFALLRRCQPACQSGRTRVFNLLSSLSSISSWLLYIVWPKGQGSFFFCHVDIQLFQPPVSKRISFPHWNILALLLKINCTWMCGVLVCVLYSAPLIMCLNFSVFTSLWVRPLFSVFSLEWVIASWFFVWWVLVNCSSCCGCSTVQDPGSPTFL